MTRSLFFKKLIKVSLLILAVVFFVAFFAFFEFTYSDTFYPGVKIAGESVGGRTYSELLQEFTAKSDALQKNGLTVIFKKGNDSKKVNIPAITTGLTSDTLVEYFSVGDLEGNIAKAFNWGHQGSFGQRLREQLLLISGKNFNIPILTHKEAIESLLSRQTKSFFAQKVPARFSFDNNNNLVIIHEKVGDNLDTQKVVDGVLSQFNTFEFKPVVFEVQSEVPYVTEAKLKPFLNVAKGFAGSANVNFYYKDHKWPVTGKTIATWLTLKPNGALGIDSEKLEAFLSKSVVPFINDPPQNSRFEMRNGVLVEIFPGKSGNAVDIDKTAESIEKIIPGIQRAFLKTEDFTAALIASNGNFDAIINPKENTIDILIETMTVDAPITKKTIDKYHIKDLVGYARTNFTGGSLDRQHNIETGVSKITGMLIAPGQEFSTVGAIGDVTEEAGFVKEYVIDGNKTIKELGGGLCQLSTTLFRTALNAGLPITERTNHAYVIPYYGPGLDATIYDPKPDFRFVNDTGNYLLLQGTAKNNEVVFELYGISDGRVVDLSAPVLSREVPVPMPRYVLSSTLAIGQTKCTMITHKGITADVTYSVRYPDGFVKEDNFHSVYQPWPDVCMIGTALPSPVAVNVQ